jgi:hypothetical protein
MSTFCFADPPYAGQAKKYRKHKDYAGEVNMGLLIATLLSYDGWALCASMKSLPHLLKMCPDDVITLAWFKPIAPPLGDHRRYAWEPVILRPVRYYGPGYVPTALIASPDMYTFRETPAEHVEGQKPEAFSHWVMASAGLVKEDEFHDLFPGSGAVAKAWDTYSPGPTVTDGYPAAKASWQAGAVVESRNQPADNHIGTDGPACQ